MVILILISLKSVFRGEWREGRYARFSDIGALCARGEHRDIKAQWFVRWILDWVRALVRSSERDYSLMKESKNSPSRLMLENQGQALAPMRHPAIATFLIAR